MHGIMTNYKQDCGKHPYSTEQKDGLDLTVFAMDLRKKNDVNRVSSDIHEIMNQTIDLSQTRNEKLRCDQINVKERDEQGERDEGDGLSVEGGSSSMLSPYSESNSPKIESVDYYENSSQLKHNATLTNMCDTPGVTMTTLQQLSQPVLPNEAAKIPIAMPMHVPLLIQHNEAERIISLPAHTPTHTECSTSTDVALITSSQGKKAPRPFKAYQKNLTHIARLPYDHNSDERYAMFRKKMLESMQTNPSNSKARKVSKSPGLPTSTVDEKDAAYWERRRKNNEAAKRSREARRAKEDDLAIRAAFLEHENQQLRRELENLQLMYKHLYNSLSII
ncbi:uncharacterized protein LOC112463690 [Temnothorax curvispinosus]|uniref:Uncharacterized protein LOC112463690 n=1 Tax=Temnothorax curvispinosus TaxID=300111 RepID=A0A6J1QU40_9HYME|nr:uncharacterized protein LOC112463690 [Temnothorax curvispinosus]